MSILRALKRIRNITTYPSEIGCANMWSLNPA